MTSPSRLQAALPAILTFIFGVAFGLIAGRMLWTKPAAAPPSAAAPMMGGGAGEGMQQQQEPDPAQAEAETRRMLALHEQQLAKSPDDVGLTRIVANYHADLGEADEALALYARARELAEKAGDEAQVTDIMIDEGIELVEKGDIKGGLERMAQAATRDPKDVRGRLTRVVVYMQRVMPAPPPGFDRKEALASAETLIAEVLAIDPQNEFAIQFQQTIDGVRGSMKRPGAAPPGEASGIPDGAPPASRP